MNISAVYAQEEVKEVQAGIGVGNAAIILFSLLCCTTHCYKHI
jgi:hypothetical protein